MISKLASTVEVISPESEKLPQSSEGTSANRRIFLEFLVWGGVFFLFRLAVQMLSKSGHFYRDEVTFIEAGLRMPASGFNSGDYIHGPILSYLLFAADSVVFAFKTVFRQVGGADDFVRWYVEHPESLGEAGRLVMSLGGAALIVVTMTLARSISGSLHHARVAALMLLSMPLFHHTSWFIKEDIWAGLLAAGAAVVAYRRRSALWTGLLWGAAIAAKYTAIALGPALLLILIEGNYDVSLWKSWLRKGAWLAGASILAFVVLNPYTLINLPSFVNQIEAINTQYLRGAVLSGSAPPYLASRLLTEFLPFDIGILAVVSICGGLIFARFKTVRHHLPVFLACATVMLMVAISRAGFPRTLALALPWLAVLAGATYQTGVRSRFRFALIPALSVAILLQAASYYRYVTAPHTAELARAYVEETIPNDAIVLMEDVHDHATDCAPALRQNISGLKAEQADIESRNAVGRLNQMRQSIASKFPAGRFEILGVKDYSSDGAGYLNQADALITCKWPSIFPENRQANLPDDPRLSPIASYQHDRQLFLEDAERTGFRIAARFEPTLVARWSFIDRPDPKVLSPLAFITNRQVVTGPEIAIYRRPAELRGGNAATLQPKSKDEGEQ